MESGFKRATITDVAAHAGVSTAAVSKVLRDAYGTSDAMKDRVRAAMDILDYRPLSSARGMRGRTFTVGVVLSDLTNPFFGVLLDAMGAELNSGGFEIFVGPGGSTEAGHMRAINAMLDHQVDGLILIGPFVEESTLSSIARRIPLVLVGQHGPSVDYDTVAGDDVLGAELVIEHLVSLGHKRIAFVSHSPQPYHDSRVVHIVRTGGYAQGMERRGLEIDIIPEEWTRAGGVAAGRRLLERDELPTAVFGGADVVAFGIMGAIWDSGRSIPGDVSIVGYDNTPDASLKPVGLTTVDQAGAHMGTLASRLLLERIAGRTEAVSELVTPSLVERNSTGRV